MTTVLKSGPGLICQSVFRKFFQVGFVTQNTNRQRENSNLCCFIGGRWIVKRKEFIPDSVRRKRCRSCNWDMLLKAHLHWRQGSTTTSTFSSDKNTADILMHSNCRGQSKITCNLCTYLSAKTSKIWCHCNSSWGTNQYRVLNVNSFLLNKI